MTSKWVATTIEKSRTNIGTSSVMRIFTTILDVQPSIQVGGERNTIQWKSKKKIFQKLSTIFAKHKSEESMRTWKATFRIFLSLSDSSITTTRILFPASVMGNMMRRLNLLKLFLINWRDNMSLLSYHQLEDLVASGVIEVDPSLINGASIDITLGDKIMIEDTRSFIDGPVDLMAKESLSMTEVDISKVGYILNPGEFILATTIEKFNLPNCIAAEYKLKSSLARSGLQHLLAGWCDPGWNNSHLTLELKNVTRNHHLLLKPGMKIGQMVFWLCDNVPEERSYAKVGQYNDQETVTGNKGVR